MSNLYNTVFINGEAYNFLHFMSLYDILVYLNFDIPRIIVEYNSKVVSNNQFRNILIQNNDKLEIITVVGGG